MKTLLFGLILISLSFPSFASTCDKTWFHVAGVSKHIAVYQPNQYTRYKRQTHPGFGVECKKGDYTFSIGQFTNSLNRPFQYTTATTDIASFSSYNIKILAGLIAGEYGRTELAPLRIIAPVAYMEYKYKHVGINLFALPPAKGLNDYIIFYTQFKIGF